MAATLIQETTDNKGNPVSSLTAAFPSNVTAGTFIIVVVGYTSTSQAAAGAVTDTRGNTYSRDVDSWTSAANSVGIWTAPNPNAGANTITFTCPTSNIPVWMGAFEWSGLATSPFDKSATAGTTGANPSVGATATLSQADELIIAAVNDGAAPTFPASGYTNWLSQNIVGSTKGGADYQIVASTTGVSASWTASSNGWKAVIGTYKINNTPTISSFTGVTYGSLTRTGPSNTPWTLSFTATDVESTGSNALNWKVYTGTSRSGTLVGSGTCTSGAAATPTIAYNASGLADGSNTLYLSVDDGVLTSADQSFTLLRDDTGPNAATSISTTPSPVI